MFGMALVVNLFDISDMHLYLFKSMNLLVLHAGTYVGN